MPFAPNPGIRKNAEYDAIRPQHAAHFRYNRIKVFDVLEQCFDNHPGAAAIVEYA